MKADFLCFMALHYRFDNEIPKMQAESGVASNYRSDHRTAIYGGRGGRDKEIDYLKDQAAVAGQGNYLMDAWGVYAAEKGVTSESRLDTRKRLFFEEKTYS